MNLLSVLHYNLITEERYGQLFIEAAPILQKGSTNLYDWVENKISFKINSSCLDTILYSFSQITEMNKEQNGKNFSLVPFENNLLVSLKDEDQTLTITLNPSEVEGLKILLKKAKERIYGW